jgi:hypothetical protein
MQEMQERFSAERKYPKLRRPEYRALPALWRFYRGNYRYLHNMS